MTLSVKPFGLICGYLLLCFLLNGCSKVTYEADCAPKLTYRFPESLPFSVMNMNEKGLVDKIKELGFVSKIGFIPMVDLNIDLKRIAAQEIVDTQAGYIQLLGPIIRYQSPKYAITREDAIYFYVNFQGSNFWTPAYQFDFFVTYFPTALHLDNQTQLTASKLDKFNNEVLPECMQK
ncbi:hypothetical protein [Shewanella surugensis]|uniref:Lipoprotein n=1 Tax=Shewanella surugensis TaxID=212020 RepID=A0ABT0LFE3_9GAMM|nr:hypothetical protein [Shewanella surugensis]MCL1126408.1 hypothetical protein [Shewanella surugensis]